MYVVEVVGGKRASGRPVMGERNGLERKARSTAAEEEDEGGWCLAGEEDIVLMEDERRLKAIEEVET